MKKEYNIFISFKKTYNNKITSDTQIARKLYWALTHEGYTPFYSEEEIIAGGYSNFGNAIDDALSSASIFIYVCTNSAFLDTPYVKYEWSSFSNEIKSGHKKNGHILGLTEGVNYSDIPYGLRGYEIFNETDQIIDAVKILLPQQKEDIPSENILEYQINKYLGKEKNIFQRKEYNQFFEFVIKNNVQLAIITYEKNIDASAIIFHEVLRWHNNGIPVLYIEGDDYGIFTRMDLTAYERLFIVFDKVYKQEQFDFIQDLLENNFNISAVCAVPNEFNNLTAQLQHLFNGANYHLDVLNDSETIEYIHSLSKEIGLPLAGNLETILLMPTLKELKTPNLLKLILTSIKKYSGYTDKDYNITNIFEIIENSLIRDHGGIDIVIEKLFSNILRKRVNRVAVNEMREHEDLMQALSSAGLVKKTNNGYVVSNKEYLYYRLSLTIFNEKGFMAAGEDFFMIEDAKPYFCYISYHETGKPPTNIIDNMDEPQKEKFLSLMISENQAFTDLAGNKSFEKALNGLLIRFRQSGLYNLANIIIAACEANNIPSTNSFDYLSEKLLIHYFQTGQYLEVETNLWKSKYYQAYLHFCFDDLETSERIYQQALELMLKENIYDIALLFDYMELSLDAGKKNKVKEILELTKNNCDAQDNEYIIRYNLLMGNICQDELTFGMAEEHYRQALKKSLEVFNLKRIQIVYGELGQLLIYMGRYDEALFYLRKNLEIAQSLSDFNGMAISTKMIAHIALLSGEYEKAYRYYGYTEMNAEQVNNNWRLYKARLYLDILDYGRKDFYMQDIDAVDLIKSDCYAATTLPLVALLKLKMSDSDENVLKILEKCRQAAKATEDLKSIAFADIVQSIATQKEPQTIPEMAKYTQDFVKAIKEISADKEKTYYLPLPNYQFKQLCGERIELRIIDVKYVSDIFEYTSSAANTKFVIWQMHRDYKDTYAYIKYTYELENAGNLFTWVIYHSGDKKVIGTIDLTYSDVYKAVEIGYILNMNYWKKGYASEAVKLVLDFVKTDLNVDKVFGIALTENAASKKVMERCGFKFDRYIDSYHNKMNIADKSGSMYVYNIEK
jgi:ribosomal-protein-alanine N-acetyltransferase